MDRRQRSTTTYDACARHWARRRGRVELVVDGYRLVFDGQPDLIYSTDGEIIGVDAWVRLYDPAGHEVPIDPHRRVVNPPLVHEGQDDPAAAFLAAVWDSVTEAPNPAGWRTRGTVTTVYSSTADGRIESGSATYSTARAGGTFITTTSDTSRYIGQWFSGSTYYCYQAYISFDTSAIPDSDVVTAVDLAMWLVSDDSVTDFTLEAREKDWGGSLTSADWVAGASLSGLTLMATLNSSGIGATGAYKTFTSQAAFTSATNLKTGTVYLVLASSRQRAGNTPSGDEGLTLSMADAAGTTQDPRLTITHAAGAQTIITGQASETDTGLALTKRKARTPGQPSETDTGQAVRGAKVKTTGQASETDTPLSATGRKTRAAGKATETDTAQTVRPAHAATTGQTSEADTGQAIAGRKARTTGQAAETDEALTVRAAKTARLGLVAETGEPFPAGARKAARLGQPVESGMVFSAAGAKSSRLGQAEELDAELAAARAKARTTGQASEVDGASGARPAKTHTLGQSVEADEAFPATGTKRGTLGQASEADEALPASVPGKLIVPLGLVVEANSALSAGRRKLRTLGQAAETGQVFPAERVKRLTLGLASETGLALPVIRGAGSAQIINIGHVTETDTTLTALGRKLRRLSVAGEDDRALPLVLATIGPPGTLTASAADASRLTAAARTSTHTPASGGGTRATTARRTALAAASSGPALTTSSSP